MLSLGMTPCSSFVNLKHVNRDDDDDSYHCNRYHHHHHLHLRQCHHHCHHNRSLLCRKIIIESNSREAAFQFEVPRLLLTFFIEFPSLHGQVAMETNAYLETNAMFH